jgi:uncharacterized protein (DUF302 family)
MTMKRTLLLGMGLAFASVVAAQGPQPTQEQIQAAMMRQMQMMAIMFDYRKSKLGFDETVGAIVNSAAKRGWQSGPVQDVQAAMKQSGAIDAKRMKVISTCPKDANERLAKASGGKLPLLPCRVTVFEAKDGKSYVVRMNTALLARGLKDEPAKVMAEIAAEEMAVLKDIVE